MDFLSLGELCLWVHVTLAELVARMVALACSRVVRILFMDLMRIAFGFSVLALARMLGNLVLCLTVGAFG